MISFKEFLHELRFADLQPHAHVWEKIPTDVLKHAQHEPPTNIDDELYQLLSKSYAYIGGHVDFKKPSDIPANHTIWYAIDVDGNSTPDAVKFGKSSPFGIKWTGGATNSSEDAKRAYLNKTVDALRTPGNYGEVSDAIMHILITRYQVPCVDSHKQVERILGKSVKWFGPHPQGKYPGWNGFYERELGGQQHIKILLGKPLHS